MAAASPLAAPVFPFLGVVKPVAPGINMSLDRFFGLTAAEVCPSSAPPGAHAERTVHWLSMLTSHGQAAHKHNIQTIVVVMCHLLLFQTLLNVAWNSANC